MPATQGAFAGLRPYVCRCESHVRPSQCAREKTPCFLRTLAAQYSWRDMDVGFGHDIHANDDADQILGR